jgi:RNA polymerase sigma-70 factor, ECF subfamily
MSRMRNEEATGSSALRAAQSGDEDGFRLLYRYMQPRLLRYLRLLVGDDAEDVASEAWLHISQGLPGFHGDLDDFRGWATTIARNRAIDHLRRLGRRPSTSEPLEALTQLPADHDTAQAALESVGTDNALALIAELPPNEGEAVLLRVVIGLDAKSAARVLRKRPGAVRTAAHRGLNRLAKLLAERDDDADPRRHVTLPDASALRKVR